MVTNAAIAGDSIGITLTEQIFIERGYVASHQTETPIETNRFHADLFLDRARTVARRIGFTICALRPRR